MTTQPEHLSKCIKMIENHQFEVGGPIPEMTAIVVCFPGIFLLSIGAPLLT